jgi:hypothetical protein
VGGIGQKRPPRPIKSTGWTRREIKRTGGTTRKDWRRGWESNRRIKVLQTSQGHLWRFALGSLLLYFHRVKALKLQPIQPHLNRHPLHFPLQYLAAIRQDHSPGLVVLAGTPREPMTPFFQNSPRRKKAANDPLGTLFRDIGAVAAACITAELENPSGVWGQTAPTRVWAAPTVLRLGLVLSPESGRGAATPRTRWVPPVLKAWRYLCCVSGGNPRPFACGFGSAWFYA